MTPFKRGSVVLALFPNSDLRTAKRRPVLIVQADGLRTGISQSVVAMISSKTQRAGHPSRIFVTAGSDVGRKSGVPHDSVILTDNLATIHHREFDKVLGVFPEMEAIDPALVHTLGISSSPFSQSDSN